MITVQQAADGGKTGMTAAELASFIGRLQMLGVDLETAVVKADTHWKTRVVLALVAEGPTTGDK